IKKKLGNGNYSDIWLVRSNTDKTRFQAAKFYRNSEFARRAEEHYSKILQYAVQKGRHPNIVNIQSITEFSVVGENDDSEQPPISAILMEKVEGSLASLKENYQINTFDDRSDVRKKFRRLNALKTDIVHAIVHLHTNGVYHANISPNNIL